MGDNVLSEVDNGMVPTEEKWNQFKSALTNDIVCRDSSGVPTLEAGDLGSTTYKWDNIYTRQLESDSFNYTLTDKTTTADFSSLERIVDTQSGVYFGNDPYVANIKTYSVTSRGRLAYARIETSGGGTYCRLAHVGLSLNTSQVNDFFANRISFAAEPSMLVSFGTIISLPAGSHSLTLFISNTSGSGTGTIDIKFTMWELL
jgi:hypothetical protein